MSTMIHPMSCGKSGDKSASKRILVVDDEPAILFAYKKLLEKEGIEVDICECHCDAIKQLKSCSYFAVIADMRLEGTDNEDGLEVLRAIREEQADIKVILVTGYGCKEIEQRAIEMGASYYFEKPVSPSIVLETLNRLHQDADVS